MFTPLQFIARVADFLMTSRSWRFILNVFYICVTFKGIFFLNKFRNTYKKKSFKKIEKNALIVLKRFPFTFKEKNILPFKLIFNVYMSVN